ncbi:MAG: PadR family transcriptional regulator [Bacteroidaceae bacterium]
MNTENTKAQMRKGLLEYCIMLLLKRRACYANDIIGQLQDADMIIMEGTLYPLLNRLKKDGILKYEWQESCSGPPRKYYTLTPEGEEALIVLDQSWNEIANTVGKLHAELSQ